MRPTVLIIDDSLTVRMDLAAAYDVAGFVTLPCGSATAAREALAGTVVDVIVLDVRLPDGDGVEMLAELRAHPSAANAPILMLSTEADVKDRIRGLTTGADVYIGKPYDVRYVIAKTQELLRTREVASNDATSAMPSVLIIDDSATFREALREAFEGDGYRVLCAADGYEGLRLAAAARPDGVIVDGILPDIDGAAVIRSLRLDAALRATPCLLLTASEESAAELVALDAGADAFARKSEDASLVLVKFRALIRKTAPPVAQLNESSPLGPKKILAVDDSPTFLNEISALLRGAGYDVVMARSGEDALELLAVEEVDCILLDLQMPGMSGQETCRLIKAVPMMRDVPLMMLTSTDSRSVMIDSLMAGADDYISKSSEFEVLAARVRAQLRRKQFEDEHRNVRDQLLRKEIEATEARAAVRLAETRAALIGELEKKNEELEAFSYSVSHDLRAPLRSIHGFSQALLEDYGPTLDEQASDYLQRVCSAAQRMGELIDDLLNLSRMGRAELHPQPEDLSVIVRSIADELARRDPGRRVEVTITDGLVAAADRRLIRAALENLLGNAWKFSGKAEHAEISFSAAQEDGELVFCVADNGDGFDMKYAERLFHPFHRLHDEKDFPGTGIGLATVHRIIERHGGRVWADAAPGRGAKFFFTIAPAPLTSGGTR